MSKIKIKRLFKQDFQLVEQFLTNNFSSPKHWPDWNLVISKYYNTEFFYFIAIENNEIIGICPIHLEKNGIFNNYYSGQFNFIPYGGWIFNKRKNINKKMFILNMLSKIQVFSLPLIHKFNNNYINFDCNYKSTLLVDLTKRIEKIWETDINSKRRNMIRKAEKNNIEIELGFTLDNFYETYREATMRIKLKLIPKEIFEELFFQTHNIKFEVISAKFSGSYLANVVLVYDKDYSIYWLGNNINNSLNLGQGELLQWNAIRRMKEKGCKYYDLCYIEKDRLPNIYEFKKGFSNYEVQVPYFSIRKFSYKIFSRLARWF